jgi:hypothetical protein
MILRISETCFTFCLYHGVPGNNNLTNRGVGAKRCNITVKIAVIANQAIRNYAVFIKNSYPLSGDGRHTTLTSLLHRDSICTGWLVVLTFLMQSYNNLLKKGVGEWIWTKYSD